jgi:hypothetical protein
MMIYRHRRVRKGEALKICPGGNMTLWTFSVKFSYGTQFLFGSLMFTVRGDENLELLTGAQCQAILGWFMEKFHTTQPIR